MRKDYVSKFDGTLASLSAPARTIYLLILKIKAHEDNKYCLKDQFFHSVEKFVEISGYETRAVKYALKELRELKIVDWIERPGRSTLYTHKKYITIYTPKNKCTLCTPLMHLMHPTHAPDAPITTKDLTTKDLTTTDDLEFKTYNEFVRQFGKERVDVVVKSLKGMNGSVNNFWGYVRSALKNGYIPTNKTSQQAEAKAKHLKFVEEEAEKFRSEQEQLQIESDKGDREYAKNIVSEFLSKHEADK